MGRLNYASTLAFGVIACASADSTQIQPTSTVAFTLSPDEFQRTNRSFSVTSGFPSNSLVLVLLDGKAISTCEDLGRQLRELRAAMRTEHRLIIATFPTDAIVVKRFLEQNRILDVDMYPHLDPADSIGRIVRPAAGRFDSLGIVTGVSHPNRVSTRTLSFANELGFAGSP